MNINLLKFKVSISEKFFKENTFRHSGHMAFLLPYCVLWNMSQHENILEPSGGGAHH